MEIEITTLNKIAEMGDLQTETTGYLKTVSHTASLDTEKKSRTTTTTGTHHNPTGHRESTPLKGIRHLTVIVLIRHRGVQQRSTSRRSRGSPTRIDINQIILRLGNNLKTPLKKRSTFLTFSRRTYNKTLNLKVGTQNTSTPRKGMMAQLQSHRISNRTSSSPREGDPSHIGLSQFRRSKLTLCRQQKKSSQSATRHTTWKTPFQILVRRTNP